MKKEDIFVVIIKQPFSYARFNLLGRELGEYAEEGIKELAHTIVDCDMGLNFPSGYRIYAVIFNDMPLVTADILFDVAKNMQSKGIKKLALGKGYVFLSCENEKTTPSYNLNSKEFLSVIDALSLKIVYNELRERIIYKHLYNGVIILEDNIVIDDTAVLEKGAIIGGGSMILGNSKIGEGAVIKASRIEDSTIGRNSTVGPFAYIRLNSEIGEGVRIGDFVEVKKSRLSSGVKAAHLSYVGDAEIGENTNVGCGTVFCNYDGKHKHQTVVGNNVFIGANTNLIAPVEVGDNAFIAAGTTVTDDLGNNSFCIGRVKQDVRPRRK